jgi:pimeloyl-ACP methyl ester carboxylesterase
MTIDTRALERHRRYEDAQAGISEEFIQPELGGARTMAVLSRPLGRASTVGWVVCHSFGMEQIHLGRQDVIAARALAAAGFPVLRFHGQGYGDSERGAEAIGFSSHLAETEDAIRLLQGQDGVERVGVAGARFGGMVAALLADRLDLPFMALWEPSARGGLYIRDLLRRELLSKMAAGDGEVGPAEMERLRDELASQGWTDIRGFRLSREAYEDISAVDLGKDLTRFSGQALLIAVSRTERINPTVSKLAQHIESLGGRTSVRLVQDQFGGQFGQFRFQTVDGGRGKRDVQLELNEKVAAATVAWCREALGAPPVGEQVPA